MSYIVFDLEFNQAYNNKLPDTNEASLQCPFEIIQVGAVKLNDNLETIATLDRLVKPQIFTKLHPFIKEMTGITRNNLNTAKSFKEVFEEFIGLVDDRNTILCVWGTADMRELFRNAKFHGLNISSIPRKYINLQSYMSKLLSCEKGTNIGLKSTVELLGIPHNNEFHDAYSDAYFTAEIFKRVYSDKIKPKLYNTNNPKLSSRSSAGKKYLDSEALINQMEKMFSRKMSEEEIIIIKLAYMMGKTNQFQISENPNSK
ncbi:3'-5' exonuclease [Clostridium thermarum]|uniref:3'-5' exonuclease n=1 Tax=Clostridium thermarum TaxID=1716543 RepID=UPI0013D7ADF7|nr:3'-5' exonuclease [Clostridium thermarum]